MAIMWMNGGAVLVTANKVILFICVAISCLFAIASSHPFRSDLITLMDIETTSETTHYVQFKFHLSCIVVHMGVNTKTVH